MQTQEKATAIVKKLVREGYTAYFAGGFVRDYLMGHPSADIDIATDAPPQAILDLFPYTVPVGLAFGVIIVVYEGHPFEVSTFRRDIEYVNGRKPEKIELATAEEDAIRRDFTINGMFYDPLEQKIFDYVHGQEDIKKGIIRTIGDPNERFFEDRLRMIRAVRFASRFGFYIDQETQQGIIDNAANLFPAVAMERIWQEISKMATGPRFDHSLIELHRLGLLQVIFPSLKVVHLNTIKERVKVFERFPKNVPPILSLMELFPHGTLKELLDICFYLKTSRDDQKLVELMHRYKPLVLSESFDKSGWTKFYAEEHSSLILNILSAKMEADKAQEFLVAHEERKKTLALHIQRSKDKSPLVNGNLLHKHGIPEGKRMGALLKEAERLVVEYDLTDPDEVVALLTQDSNWKGDF